MYRICDMGTEVKPRKSQCCSIQRFDDIHVVTSGRVRPDLLLWTPVRAREYGMIPAGTIWGLFSGLEAAVVLRNLSGSDPIVPHATVSNLCSRAVLNSTLPGYFPSAWLSVQ